MRRTSAQDGAIGTTVTIDCPVDAVFAYYRDFTNLPAFMGDIMAVTQIDPTSWRWTVQGPLGIRKAWTARVTRDRPAELLSYEVEFLPGVRTSWDVYFTGGPGARETQVREVMTTPFGRVWRAALTLLGKPPDKEMAANLRRLKQVMETGTVTDTSFAAPGKFTPRPHAAG